MALLRDLTVLCVLELSAPHVLFSGLLVTSPANFPHVLPALAVVLVFLTLPLFPNSRARQQQALLLQPSLSRHPPRL
jgi:hypothetical protein